jgi:hypothetical protein
MGDDAPLSHATTLDVTRHGSIDQVVRRAFGGTSWIWGGRCVAFDDIDFERRTYVPLDGLATLDKNGERLRRRAQLCSRLRRSRDDTVAPRAPT